jgi:pentalenene oxygenase
MAWTHYFIMKHPEVERKLRDELKDVLGDRLPQYDDLDKLPYLDRVVRETLRLHPPSWLITRRTIKPTRLGEYIIPANSLLIMSQYASHRHPDLWPDPLTFEPDRFALPHEDRQHKYSYYSFGDGPRHCIGQRIAILEIMISVSTLLQRFRLELEPDQVVEPVALSALKPRNGILAKVVGV